MCESDTAALCKSNGKDTFYTISGMAWQGNGMGTAWARHAMCESAFKVPLFIGMTKESTVYVSEICVWAEFLS
jgi:hypothetical protein